MIELIQNASYDQIFFTVIGIAFLIRLAYDIITDEQH